MNSFQQRLLDAQIAGSINPARRYVPYGQSARLISSTRPEVLISGAANTGKSRSCLEKLNFCAWNWPGSRHLIVRKTKASLAESALQTYEQHVMGEDNPIVMGARRQFRQSYRYPNGSVIVVGGMDKATRIMSTEFDLVYVQEAIEIELGDWEALTTRLRNNVLPFQQIIADTNPAAPSHWLKQRCDAGVTEFLDSRHEDNPLLWDAVVGAWTEDGQRYIARLETLTGVRLLRLRHGMWVMPPGAIYEVFDNERHKVKSFPIPALWPRCVGIDPVGAHIAAVWVAYDPKGEAIHVYREYCEEFGLTTGGHAENILRISRLETIFAWVGGGPSERQARTDWEGAGIPLIAPAVTDVWAQIDRVIGLLRGYRLFVHDCCIGLLDEIGRYRRKERGGEFVQEIADKEQFDLLDALRYVIGWLVEPADEVEIVHRPVKIW